MLISTCHRSECCLCVGLHRGHVQPGQTQLTGWGYQPESPHSVVKAAFVTVRNSEKRVDEKATQQNRVWKRQKRGVCSLITKRAWWPTWLPFTKLKFYLFFLQIWSWVFPDWMVNLWWTPYNSLSNIVISISEITLCNIKDTLYNLGEEKNKYIYFLNLLIAWKWIRVQGPSPIE